MSEDERVSALADWLADLGLDDPDADGWQGGLDYDQQAERILSDPGPLLAVLAEAGILTRVTAILPPRQDPMRPRGRGGVHWAAERYVSEWRPDSRFEDRDLNHDRASTED